MILVARYCYHGRYWGTWIWEFGGFGIWGLRNAGFFHIPFAECQVFNNRGMDKLALHPTPTAPTPLTTTRSQQTFTLFLCRAM